MSRVADIPGKYTDFSGEIYYNMRGCKVIDSTFELLEKPEKFKGKLDIWILFEKGTIVNGNLYYADIKQCNFYGKNLSHSIFRNGDYREGGIDNSYWLGGTWHNGTWEANNYDKFGRERLFPPPFDKIDKITGTTITVPGRYKNFTGRVQYAYSDFHIVNGDLEIDKGYGGSCFSIDNGVITEGQLENAAISYVEFKGKRLQGATWKNGVFDGGEFTGFGGTWEGGTWKGGHWWGNTWEGGTWEGGVWHDGTWLDGTWLGGIWKSGVWSGGYDKNGNYHGKDDSPNKWKNI